MKTVGFDKPLYILPFDHRGSFQSKMFGWKGTLTSEQTAQIAATKQVIYDGFKTAVSLGVPRQKAAILVDEQFGAAILRDATSQGYTTACPVEKSGQEEFDFEYGEEFAKHVESVKPTFSKVLVRYNPEGDQALNARQAARLRRGRFGEMEIGLVETGKGVRPRQAVERAVERVGPCMIGADEPRRADRLAAVDGRAASTRQALGLRATRTGEAGRHGH